MTGRWLVLLLSVALTVRPEVLQASAPEVVEPTALANPSQAFDVLEFRVLGNSALLSRDVEAAVYPFLGPHREFKDVEAARDALVSRYRAAGLGTVLVDIPEQSVDDGIVRLKVTEGRVDRVTVSGSRYYSNRRILAALPSIESGAVPRLPELQKELQQLAQAAPDRQITPLLRAGRTPGTVDVDLKVQDRLPLHASLEANNRFSADTTHTRLAGTVSYDNLFQRENSVSLQYQVAPESSREVNIWALTYLGRLPHSTNFWSAYAVDSNSDAASLGTLSVIGRGHIFGARFVMPGEALGSWYPSATLGFDYKSFTESIMLAASGPAYTPIHYATGNADLSVVRSSEHLDAGLSTSLKVGVRGLANTEQEFEYKRYLGRPSFLTLNATGRVTEHMPALWYATERLSFQVAPAPIISNEQFAIGGADTVRGYLEAEDLMDSGAIASLEVGRALWLSSAHPDSSLSVFAFSDYGFGKLEDPLPRQIAYVHLASTGAGARLSMPRALEADLSWTYPLLAGSRTRIAEKQALFLVRVGF